MSEKSTLFLHAVMIFSFIQYLKQKKCVLNCRELFSGWEQTHTLCAEFALYDSIQIRMAACDRCRTDARLNCRIWHLKLLCWFLAVFIGTEKGPFIEAAKRIRLFSAQRSSAQLWPQAGLFKWLQWSVKWRSLHSVAQHSGAASSLEKELIRCLCFKNQILTSTIH